MLTEKSYSIFVNTSWWLPEHLKHSNSESMKQYHGKILTQQQKNSCFSYLLHLLFLIITEGNTRQIIKIVNNFNAFDSNHCLISVGHWMENYLICHCGFWQYFQSFYRLSAYDRVINFLLPTIILSIILNFALSGISKFQHVHQY